MALNAVRETQGIASLHIVGETGHAPWVARIGGESGHAPCVARIGGILRPGWVEFVIQPSRGIGNNVFRNGLIGGYVIPDDVVVESGLPGEIGIY